MKKTFLIVAAIGLTIAACSPKVNGGEKVIRHHIESSDNGESVYSVIVVTGTDTTEKTVSKDEFFKYKNGEVAK